MKDLIYKIYSVWLYDNQLNHDYVFFYNRSLSFNGELYCDAPGYMFGNYSWSASTKISCMDKNDPNFKEESIYLMTKEAEKAGVIMMKASDIITLIPLGEGRISYTSSISPNDKLETEGKYKGLKKKMFIHLMILFGMKLKLILIHINLK